MAITKIGTPELFDFSATNTALQLPTGTTLERPTSPSAGQWRFNTDEKYVEFWDGGAWRQIDTEAPANPDEFPSQNFNVNTYFGTGAAQKIDAKFNEAANFNGSSSKIVLPSYGTTFENNFSVSLWFNINTIPSSGIISFITGQNDYYFYCFLRDSDKKIETRVEIGGTGHVVKSSTTFSNNSGWYQVSVTKSSTDGLKLYVNGSLENSDATATGNVNSESSTSLLGAYGNTQYYLDGKIDQVRIFNTALPATGTASVATLYAETTTTAATLNFPVGAGCIAAYQLDGDASDVGGTYGGVETNIGYTGLKFQADMIWIKTRNQAFDHNLVDSIRGTTKYLRPNRDIAEVTQSDGVTSLNTTNGFTVGVGGDFGASNNEYVAWAFKGGGAPTATNSAGAGNVPTAGSVKIDGADSTTALAGATPATNISANTGSGFSIVKYTGPASNSTIAHGLGVTPSMMIQKPTGVGSWNVYIAPGIIDATSNYYYLVLNSTGSKGTTSSAVPTTTTFNAAASGAIIAYCFADIAGYQKIGSYTGTSASSNIISTEITSGDGGFEPAFLMIKRTDANGGWIMLDNKRSTSNPRTKYLQANNADAEGDAASIDVDFLTNGFSVGGNNSDINVGTYIYLAIAADKDSSVPTQANSFSPTLYSGTGAVQNVYTPFAPDFTWMKGISFTDFHSLLDSVRGPFVLGSSQLDGESAFAGFNFNPNGFTVPVSGQANPSGQTLVSWNWKAGGLPTINNDGSITSIVSANQASGFSIAKYIGNNTQNATVGHGLGIEPKMVIIKRLDVANAWWIPLPILGSNQFMEFSTASATTDVQYQYTQTTDVFKFTSATQSAQYNASGGSYIMYSFADIAGYQKVGTYPGSNSSSKVVYTTSDGTSTGTGGFQPRFLLIKSTSSNGNFWNMFDSARTSGANGKGRLYPNSAAAEDGTLDISFNANNFTLLTSNSDINGGNDYLYLAIA